MTTSEEKIEELRKSIILENDLQNKEIEFSFTGELIPFELVEEGIKEVEKTSYEKGQKDKKKEMLLKFKEHFERNNIIYRGGNSLSVESFVNYMIEEINNELKEAK
jgi:hypothetical protein